MWLLCMVIFCINLKSSLSNVIKSFHAAPIEHHRSTLLFLSVHSSIQCFSKLFMVIPYNRWSGMSCMMLPWISEISLFYYTPIHIKTLIFSMRIFKGSLKIQCWMQIIFKNQTNLKLLCHQRIFKIIKL